MFRFQTKFVARLQTGITATAASFTLSSVPAALPAGRYSFRFGSNLFSSEWLSADYAGAGSTFTAATRSGEGGNPPRAWPAATVVTNVLTGEAIDSLQVTLQQSNGGPSLDGVRTIVVGDGLTVSVTGTIARIDGALLGHEEFSPATGATTVSLSQVPSVVLVLSRNGLVQSVAAGHYSLSGPTITFSSSFSPAERVVVAYSYKSGVPPGVQLVELPPRAARRARDYSHVNVHTTPT